MVTAGFEPAHPEIVGLKSTALDHSAKLPYLQQFFLETSPRFEPRTSDVVCTFAVALPTRPTRAVRYTNEYMYKYIYKDDMQKMIAKKNQYIISIFMK